MTPEFALDCFLKACVEDGGMDSGALKAAMAAYVGVHLAQPQGEPVAWINPAGTYAEASTSSTVYGSHTIPLYIHPAHTEADIDAARDCCV